MSVRYPKGEIVWTAYYNAKKELKFLLTSKPARDAYFLYRVDGEEIKKLGKAATPTELEKKYKVDDVIRKG